MLNSDVTTSYVCGVQAQGVFQFFNKPGQKGHQGQGSRRTPQAATRSQEEEAAAVNADWGNQQVRLVTHAAVLCGQHLCV